MDQRSTVTKRTSFLDRENVELPLFFDRSFDKSRIKTFIGWLLFHFGDNVTLYIVEKLKNLGFYFATGAGISLSIDDLQVPSNKNWLLSEAEKEIKENGNNFQCGNVTPVEQSQHLLDRWHRTSETLKESVIQSFRLTNTLNPVYMMAFSGARGNISQVRQLVGMRGFMADPQGQIIRFPIRSNFREGLTLTEYVISCYGARKGVVDTALRTADSGYLTRRLVDVSQHITVWTFDCKAKVGIHLTEMKEGKKVILPLKKRILGRILAEEITTTSEQNTEKVIAFRNQQISAQLAHEIVSLKEQVLVRSPLCCRLHHSVCQLCYGWSLSRGRIVLLGEAVGVIAAQSIGEPGTQLTMRTFHTGGVFSGDVIDEIRAPYDGVINFLQPFLGQLIRTSHGKIAYLIRASGSLVIEKNFDLFNEICPPSNSEEQKKGSLYLPLPLLPKRTKGEGRLFAKQGGRLSPEGRGMKNVSHTVITLEPGTALFVRQGEKVIAKQLLAEYSSISAQTKERVEGQQPVYSDQKGEIFFDDVSSTIDPAELKRDEGYALSIARRISFELSTLWILAGTSFQSPVSLALYPKIGDLIDKTTLLTLIQSELNLHPRLSLPPSEGQSLPDLSREYTLSAQLDKTAKGREKWISFSKQNLASNPSTQSIESSSLLRKEPTLPNILQKERLPFQKGNLQNRTRPDDDCALNFVFAKQKQNVSATMKERYSLFLNQFSLNLTITNIKYKKSGYFFTDCKKEKPSNLYSFFIQAGSVNLVNNVTNLKNDKQSVRRVGALPSLSSQALILQSKMHSLNFGKVETNFLNFLKSSIAIKQKPLLGKEMKNSFVLTEARGGFFFNFILENSSMRSIEIAMSKNVGKQHDCALNFVFAKPKQNVSTTIDRRSIVLTFCKGKGSRTLILKYSKESSKAKDFWFRRKRNSVTLNERKTVSRENKVETKRNVNLFFTTTSLNQPFSNGREFKNEFILQWFSPLFKTETGGLIYTNNYYSNKRSKEAHLFFIAEESYGRKDLGKMDFSTRKKSFNIVSFKELTPPPICLTNVSLNGKKRPNSSFKSFFPLSSGNLANTLSTKKSGSVSANTTTPTPTGESDVLSMQEVDYTRRVEGDSVQGLEDLAETKKEFFFLRKKESYPFPLSKGRSLHSLPFHSTKRSNITINLLKKGFLSFKSKWVETNIPVGYQKNLQGNQIPFYSTENGVLKNKLAPSFFINQYSNLWEKRKIKKFSGSFLKDFLPVTFKHPLPYIKMRANSSERPPSFEQSLSPSKGQSDPAFLDSKEKIRFSLLFLLAKSHLSLTKSKPLNFNPFPSKGNYSWSALMFRINVRAIRGSHPLEATPLTFCKQNVSGVFYKIKNKAFDSKKQFQRQSSAFYNSYPYPQPILVVDSILWMEEDSILWMEEFLQNKPSTYPRKGQRVESTSVPSREFTITNFNSFPKGLKTNLGLQDKHVVLQSKSLFSKISPLTLQREKRETNLKNLEKSKDSHHSMQQMEEGSLQRKEEDSIQQTGEFPRDFVLYNDSQNIKDKDQKLSKFSSFLQKQIKKRPTKKQKKTDENLQGFHLQIRSGWLYLPKDQFQTAKVHQSFIPPFQQKIDEILFDQFSVYVESILRKNFEEELTDKYLQPFSDIVDSCKTKTLVEKSQLQKFINQIPKRKEAFLRFEKQNVTGLPFHKLPFDPRHVSIFKQRSNKFLLSLRETFWRGSIFSSFVENHFTTFPGRSKEGIITAGDKNSKDILKLSKKDISYQTNLPANFSNHTTISNTSSFLSFLLRDKKERKRKYLQEKNIFSQATSHQQKETTEKQVFLRPVSINPIKIVFQVVTNKSCRFNSIRSFALSSINETHFYFSHDFFLQSQIIDRKLTGKVVSQKETRTKNKVNPGSYSTIAGGPEFFLCLPQISRIYFVKNKPFSDFVLVSRKFNFDPVKNKSHASSDTSWKGKEGVSTFSLKENTVSVENVETPPSFGWSLPTETSKKSRDNRQDSAESFILSEKNKSLISRAKQIPVPTKKKSTRYKNLFQIFQSKTFLIENFSTEVDTNYLSFLLLIPTSLKNEKSVNGTTNTLALQKETLHFQKKKLSFSKLFYEKSKLWLLIRKVAEYPLLDTFISQQKTRLHRVNQPFFEKELIYSSTPLSLYMSNKITFSSKFNKQKKEGALYANRGDEARIAIAAGDASKGRRNTLPNPTPERGEGCRVNSPVYNSPKVGLKIKENIFCLLDPFFKLEKQDLANLSADFLEDQFFEEKSRRVENDSIQRTEVGSTYPRKGRRVEEDSVQRTEDFLSCQKIFWHIFDLHRQNRQKKRFFEGKQPLFLKKISALQESDTATWLLPTDTTSFDVFDKTWVFLKENLENGLFPKEKEKEETIIRSFKQSYLLHFLLNFHISKESPSQRIKIKTTFEKIEGSTQTSSCAHYLNLQEGDKKAKNEFFINRNSVRINDLSSQNRKTDVDSMQTLYPLDRAYLYPKGKAFMEEDSVQRTENLQKNDEQSKLSAFTGLNLNERDDLFDVGLITRTNPDITPGIARDRGRLYAKQGDFAYILLRKMYCLHDILRSKMHAHRIATAAGRGRVSSEMEKKETKGENPQALDKTNFEFSQEKSKFWKYSFTPFARDLAFTLSFTVKINQSSFFSLGNNRIETSSPVGSSLPVFKESQPLQGPQSLTSQSQKFIKETFLFTNQIELNEKKTKHHYLKNKKLISKQNSSYPLREKSSHTTLLLDQTITAYNKTPVAMTTLMSREEGEIANIKNNSACLILKNSDIEILLTKEEKPLVVVGQLIRYGEEIANGIAAPKSGQIIQVDSNRVTLRKAQPILFPKGIKKGSLDVNHGDYVTEGSPLFTLSYQRLVTGDIVQGIPKIEQLFEARGTEGGQPLSNSLQSELEALFQSYNTNTKHDLKSAVRESVKDIQQIIVDRVQRVYIAQGVLIADKHFEVVIRQMTSKVRIIEGNRPGFLYGELVDLKWVELLNDGVPFPGGPATYEPIILGISRVCLEAEGFLSPASFQETTRVLTLAAIERKTDFLRGIKERVILGDVIQAGTGLTLYHRPVKQLKREKCLELYLSTLHKAYSILCTNQYYKQL